MKHYHKLIIAIFTSVSLVSCSKDFLQRSPLDEVTALDYFKAPDDLKAYVNQYYASMFPKYGNHGSDFNSDNEITLSPDRRLEGSRTVSTSGSIGFGNVRSINYFFDHYRKVEEKHELGEYQQYLGEAYFFRALIYYGLLRSYGDIQWQQTGLGTSSPELYNARDPRNVVADNILLALDSAAMYLGAEQGAGAGRVNRWMALLVQSRVALYEGSWEKYHAGTPFGVEGSDPSKYFRKAADAAREVIDQGPYRIYSTGDPGSDYRDLFSSQDYTRHPEVMFWREYNNELTRGQKGFTNDRNFRMETPSGKTATKWLADSYLCSDGLPISLSPRFGGHGTLGSEAAGRDPRFRQTIATPDQVWKIFQNGDVLYWDEIYDNLNKTADYNAPSGYVIQKGYNPNMAYHIQQYEESPSILYRYAEVLLNYAEAKAELGELTQADIDISIKPLRDRVGMPNLVLSDIQADPDWHFPGLSPAINEIRRERRVELALEGFRWDDIARWAAADELLIGERPKGFKASQVANNTFPVDGDGFLDPFQIALPDGYQFDPERDYLNSIPETEIVLNPALTQNPGW